MAEAVSLEAFQFFPSCYAETPKVTSPTHKAFNSFPVATRLRLQRLRRLVDHPAFNSFPVATRLQRAGKSSRGTHALLSILSQLLPSPSRLASALAILAFNSFPVATRVGVCRCQ